MTSNHKRFVERTLVTAVRGALTALAFVPGVYAADASEDAILELTQPVNQVQIGAGYVDKDSAKFGIIEYTFKLPVNSIKTPMGGVDTTDGSEMTVTTTVDGCIDGTLFGASSKGKIEGKIGMKIPGVDAAIVMDGTIETKSEPVKKK